MTAVFEGNRPHNVNRDAKYSVRSNRQDRLGENVVSLIFESDEDERWYATTDEHPELVRMVNGVKEGAGLRPNGSFYINEYQQVIVPTAQDDEYYLAGTYANPLRFDFDGKVLTGAPVSLEGAPLSPGDDWVGPHPGISYVLAAGGKDIYYKITRTVSGGRVERTVRLSKQIAPASAEEVASRIREYKGHEGGKFYVNEHQAIFAPIEDYDGWRYVYVGQVDLKTWFPNPQTKP